MYRFNLTEEIARWGFEIICRENPDWYIAFTNPTAGPWKTIRGCDAYGREGEVYRFELEETRPDIILVNDPLELILIIEAKDSIEKLASHDQAVKSVEVVHKLYQILKGKKAAANPYWRNRASYTLLTGLLWGAAVPVEPFKRTELFDAYHDIMEGFPALNRHLIVGVETRRRDDGIICCLCGRRYDADPASISLDQIASSLDLPLIPDQSR